MNTRPTVRRASVGPRSSRRLAAARRRSRIFPKSSVGLTGAPLRDSTAAPGKKLRGPFGSATLKLAMAERRQTRGGKRGIRKKDLALVFGPSADGEGFNILRRRAGSEAVEA